MLAFGESMLNDAVAIVLASTALEMNAVDMRHLSTFTISCYAISRFMAMFFMSALLGFVIGVISSLVNFLAIIYKKIQNV
jgi:sodium/hydrogen exchanger 8